MGINFSNVGFKYDVKASNTLNDINLQIDKNNEFITILGHTGSGKSTLVQLMNALNLPTSGSVKVMDTVVEKDNKPLLKPIRKSVGLVFQFPEYQLFEETVLKDVMFAPKNFFKDEKDAKERAIKISEIIGIDDLLEKSPFSLSGGQMRKVAIAGVLASNPDILVLDEPTVGLDPIAKKELLELLKELNEKYHKTIIIITHDMDVVSEYIKRVIVLKQGNLMYDGPKSELFKNEELVEDCNLGLPSVVQLLKDIKKKLNIDIDEYQYNLNDAYQELVRKLGEHNE